jgi:phage shock protein PspC (stress-responsive transcriptional regulator)
MFAGLEDVKKNKTNLMIAGTVLLFAGITMVLAWWPDVVSLIKGFIGIVVAIAGLFILYLIKE